MKRKNIDMTDSKKLWKNLGIDNPSANLEKLDKFYNKYNNFFPGRERGKICNCRSEKSIN